MVALIAGLFALRLIRRYVVRLMDSACDSVFADTDTDKSGGIDGECINLAHFSFLYQLGHLTSGTELELCVLKIYEKINLYVRAKRPSRAEILSYLEVLFSIVKIGFVFGSQCNIESESGN